MTGTIHQLKIENQGKLGSKLMDVIRTFKNKTSNGTKSIDIFHITKMNRDIQKTPRICEFESIPLISLK